MMHCSRLFAAVIALAAVVLLNACNTTAGIGKDVSAAGHAVSHTAETVKDKL